jgi:hypothetical protein
VPCRGRALHENGGAVLQIRARDNTVGVVYFGPVHLVVPQGRHQPNETSASSGMFLTVGEKVISKYVAVIVKLVLVEWLFILVFGKESGQVDGAWNCMIEA